MISQAIKAAEAKRLEEQRNNPLVNIFGVPIIEHVAFSREEAEEEEEVVLMSWNTGLSDDERMWEEACRFFRHDACDTEQGVRLPGLKITTRNYQMVDVYKMLRACFSTEYKGSFNCSKPGLGKTLEVLVAASSVALAYMSKENYQEDPEAHQHEEEGRCALEHPFGIECYCITNSLTRQICKTIHRAPQLVVAPAGIVKQWCKEWAKTMEEQIRFDNGHTVPGPLLRLACIENSKVRTAQMNGVRKLVAMDFIAAVDSEGEVYAHHKMKLRMAKRQSVPAADLKTTDEELYTFMLGDTKAYGSSFNCRVGVKAKTEDGIGRERLVLVCSSGMISNGSCDKIFKAAIEVSQVGRKTDRTIFLTRCFSPGAVYYDEWTEGKGKDTNIIRTLRHLCVNAETSVDSLKRPLVCLLSGTPMPRGPKCLEGVMPLVSAEKKMEKQVEELVQAYDKAHTGMQNMRLQKNGRGAEADLYHLKQWQMKAESALNGCMFQRRYGMPFLDGHIPDPRPRILRYPPYFSATSAEHQEQIDALRTSLKNRIVNMASHHTQAQHLELVSKTAEFQAAHRCAVLPGIPSLGPRLMKWLFHRSGNIDADDGIMREYLKDKIHKAQCRQLDLVQQVVQEQGSRGDHGLVLTVAPSNVLVTVEWLQSQLDDSFQVIEVTASNPKPGNRAAFVAELEKWIGLNPNRRVVIVSTYKLLSTGIDGLQRFANYLVKLGEPWTTKETEQAEGRIHRSGQKKLSVVYSIHGAKESIDWELVQKNNRNMHLLGASSQGILGEFMGSTKQETIVIDDTDMEKDADEDYMLEGEI